MFYATDILGDRVSRTSKGNESWFEKLGVRNIVGKITVKPIQGKRLLVRVIGGFEKSRVREIVIKLVLGQPFKIVFQSKDLFFKWCEKGCSRVQFLKSETLPCNTQFTTRIRVRLKARLNGLDIC